MRAAVINKDEKMIDFLISEFHLESVYYFSSIYGFSALMEKYTNYQKVKKMTMLMYAARRLDLQGVHNFFGIKLKGKKVDNKTALMMAFEADHSTSERKKAFHQIVQILMGCRMEL